MQIYKTILILVMFSLLVLPQRTITEDVYIEPQSIARVKSTWTAIEIKSLITDISAKYGVSESVMNTIVKCESRYNITAHNKTKIENSVGLVQINLKAHPYITYTQAIDPEFSLEFLAKNLKKGKGRMWSCYQTFYG